jgi:hypothetical protein
VHVDRYMRESGCYRESCAIPCRRFVGVDPECLVAVCGTCISPSVHCADLISLIILMNLSLKKCGMKAVESGNSTNFKVSDVQSVSCARHLTYPRYLHGVAPVAAALEQLQALLDTKLDQVHGLDAINRLSPSMCSKEQRTN